jgi:membrane fusion protein (multidrug efflux system)
MPRLTLLVLTLAAALAVSGLLLLVSSPSEQTAAVADVTAPNALAVRVPALEVARAVARDRIRVSGLITPGRRVTVAAQVDGQVVELGAREHDAVQDGQVIVQLDDTLRRAALERAEATLLRARAAHRLAQIELDRQERLFRRGIASASARDRARSEDSATFGALREGRAMRAEAVELLERTTVAAPFDGILSILDLEVGDRVNTGDRIGEVIDISEVKVDIGVTDAQVIAVQEGDTAEVDVSVRPGQAFRGRIRRVGSAIDAASRKFPVEIVVENPQMLLLPGMVVRVTIEVGQTRPTIRIPRQAMIEEFGVAYVFVLGREGEALRAKRRRVTVQPVAFRPAELEVRDGLRPGEQIAAANLRELRDGAKVIVEERR